MKFLLFVLAFSSATGFSAADLPLSYEVHIEGRQYDPMNFGPFKLRFKKDARVILRETGIGAWDGDIDIDERYSFTITLFDFEKITGDKRVRLDLRIFRKDEVSTSSGKKFIIYHTACESRLNHKAMEDLQILEKSKAFASCTDPNLLQVKMAVQKI